MLSPQLTGVAENATLPFASTLCGACYDVCPVAIDIPTMLVHLRAKVVADKADHHRLPGGERALMTSAAWAMGNPRRWRYALRSARAGRLLGRRAAGSPPLPPPLVGLDGEPRPAPAADAELPRLVEPGPEAARR